MLRAEAAREGRVAASPQAEGVAEAEPPPARELPGEEPRERLRMGQGEAEAPRGASARHRDGSAGQPGVE